MSDSRLAEKVRERLRSSEFFTSRSRETASKFYGLVCPECGKPEAWAYVESPMAIICNRKNECGARVRTLELFPEVLANLERDFQPTKDDPQRPATEYLKSRGISSKTLKGVIYEYWKTIRKTKSGGVMFYVGRAIERGDEVWNGRLFSPPEGESKSHNRGATAGLFWRHPTLDYSVKAPIYVTEGIIDALSLIEMGCLAIAVISSGQDPGKVDIPPDWEGRLRLAFDPDAAGAGGLRKWRSKYPSASLAVPTGGDWNDFLRAQAPGQASETLDLRLPEFAVNGELMLSESASDYAAVYRDFYGYAPGLFPFRGYMYWSWSGPKDVIMIKRAGNFTVDVDHYQLDRTNPDEPVFRYHLRVHPCGDRPVMCTISGSEMASAANMRSTFLNRAKVLWEGEAPATAALTRKIVETKSPVVRQAAIVGRDVESGVFLFQNFAVDPGGKVMKQDNQGFFRVSRHEYLRPPDIATLKPRNGADPAKIYRLLDAAWPDNGPLALAWTVASWWVHAIKEELGMFPFLSLWGDTQTGKTRLTRILNAIQCLDEEGMPMSRLNTGKGEIRKLAQRSGLMRALLESTREEAMRFDLDAILTLFNVGNSLQVRAIKSNDLRTQETPFLSALAFVQNREPFKTKAQMERIISSRKFEKDDINEGTKEAFTELIRTPLQKLAGLFVMVMGSRRHIDEIWLSEFEKARDEILREIQDNRLAETHAVVLAFHRIILKLWKISRKDPLDFMVKLASEKRDRCNHRQATTADAFFDAINELEPETRDHFCDVETGRLYVKLTLAVKILESNRFMFPRTDLYGDLREHPAYLDSNIQRRGHFGRVTTQNTKCWVFDLAKVWNAEEECKLVAGER